MFLLKVQPLVTAPPNSFAESLWRKARGGAERSPSNSAIHMVAGARTHRYQKPSALRSTWFNTGSFPEREPTKGRLALSPWRSWLSLVAKSSRRAAPYPAGQHASTTRGAPPSNGSRRARPPPTGPSLSCHRFRANEVRLLLGVIAYNLGNLLRRLVLPLAIQKLVAH